MPNLIPYLELYGAIAIVAALWFVEQARKAPLIDDSIRWIGPDQPGHRIDTIRTAPKPPSRDGCWSPDGRLTTVASRLTDLTGVNISDADVTSVLMRNGLNLRRGSQGQRSLWEWHLQREVVKDHIRRDVQPARLVAL